MKVLLTPAIKPVKILQDAGYVFMPVWNSTKLIGYTTEDWQKIQDKCVELDNVLESLPEPQKKLQELYLDGECCFYAACFTIREIIPGKYDRQEINSLKHLKQVAMSCNTKSPVETDAEIIYYDKESFPLWDEAETFDLLNIGD